MLHSLQHLSSLTRDQTWAPAVEVWSPNHRTTREVPILLIYSCTYSIKTDIFCARYQSRHWRHTSEQNKPRFLPTQSLVLMGRKQTDKYNVGQSAGWEYGRAEGPGNDAILKGSQEAPLEKHLKEARQEEYSRHRGQPRQLREPHLSLRHIHTPPGPRMRRKLDGSCPEGGCPQEEEVSWPYPQVLCPGLREVAVQEPLSTATCGCIAP